MNSYQIQAQRHAREVVGELRWQGMTVPPLYTRMAAEFEDLVGSGEYAAWVAANQKPALAGGPSRVSALFALSPPSRNGHSHVTRHVRPAPAGRVARRRRLLPGPALGR